MTDTVQTLDVRDLPPRERHPRIFALLDHLPPGDALRLVNDHDSKPLWYQLQAERPGEFRWTSLEEGPERWSVAIARIAAAAEPHQPVVQPAAAAASADTAGPYLDNRGLEPPEPMIRILEALATLATDATLRARLDREPLLLYPQLTNRGFVYSVVPDEDDSYLIRIWREARGER